MYPLPAFPIHVPRSPVFPAGLWPWRDSLVSAEHSIFFRFLSSQFGLQPFLLYPQGEKRPAAPLLRMSSGLHTCFFNCLTVLRPCWGQCHQTARCWSHCPRVPYSSFPGPWTIASTSVFPPHLHSVKWPSAILAIEIPGPWVGILILLGTEWSCPQTLSLLPAFSDPSWCQPYPFGSPRRQVVGWSWERRRFIRR